MTSGEAGFSRGGSRELGAPPLACLLFLLTVSVLFSVPGGMLWYLGLNYDGVSGAAASKIHPATYLAIATLLLVAAGRSNPASIISLLMEQYGGSLALLVAAVAVLLFVTITDRPGLAGLVDTFCLPAVLAVVVAETSVKTRKCAEMLVHTVLAFNAFMTIFEFLTGYRIFPPRFEGEVPVELRAAGLQGHALPNAVITGTYLTVLISRARLQLSSSTRAVAIMTQLAALIASGGRAATTIAIIIMLFRLLEELLSLLHGRPISRLRAALYCSGAPLAFMAAVMGLKFGVFDVLIERFTNDGGSAMTRAQMLRIFGHVPLRDIIVGPEVQLIESLRRAQGLELGIENPLVRFVLYQGAIATAALLIGVVLFCVQLARALRPGYALPFLYFFATIMTFESLGSKGTLLAKFGVMLAVMLPLDEGHRSS